MIGSFAFISGVNGATLVGLAAYGAHSGATAVGTETVATPATLFEAAAFQTAWQLHAVHSACFLALSMCRRPNAWLNVAFWLLLGGVALFSGTLYGQALGWSGLGPILAPVGGVLMLGGWLSLAVAGAWRIGHGSNGIPSS